MKEVGLRLIYQSEEKWLTRRLGQHTGRSSAWFRARRSGRRGRPFESARPDQFSERLTTFLCLLFSPVFSNVSIYVLLFSRFSNVSKSVSSN